MLESEEEDVRVCLVDDEFATETLVLGACSVEEEVVKKIGDAIEDVLGPCGV